MRLIPFLFLLLPLMVAPLEGAEPAKKPAPKPESTRWDTMDVGPFFTGGFGGPAPAYKGLSIKLGSDTEAALCFDTELLRVAMGWTGGFLKLPTGRGGLEGTPQPAGTPLFTTPRLPGWGNKGDFTDPRLRFKDNPCGPLPRDWAHYNGLYQHGRDIILSYSVDRVDILELPQFERVNGAPVFTRTFQVEKSARAQSLLLLDAAGASVSVESDGPILRGPGGIIAISVSGLTGARWISRENNIILELPPAKARRTFQVRIAGATDTASALAAARLKPALPNLDKLCHGGTPLWGEPLVTQGTLGKEEGAYQVDSLTLPDQNPWNSWIRLSGIDFFPDGRAAVCSVSGDVWIVGGLDGNLDHLTWKRFATGLFQPLGLRIVKDRIYVTGRDQITRLHDLNGDGEADFYENFNNDISITSHYHEFCLGLETDSKGNFYFAKGGNLGAAAIPHHGTLVKVSRDGRKLEIVATGLRAPNGMSVGPHDEITVSDNEGNWVPSSRVNLVRPGGFYGHVFTSHRDTAPSETDPPLLWLPHNNTIDNSSGGQVWVTSRKWGPFHGALLHTSYGTCSLFHVMTQEINGTWQAAAARFPLRFETGIMRGRFHPRDGLLYLCGLSVWQSNAARQGGLQRVRYTGKPANFPARFTASPGRLELQFTDPLDPATATDAENFSVDQWNYHWTSAYGSPEFSVKDPARKGHDPVEIRTLTLSPDRRRITLSVPGLAPVMQLRVRYHVKAADGTDLQQEVYSTLNRVGETKGTVAAIR